MNKVIFSMKLLYLSTDLVFNCSIKMQFNRFIYKSDDLNLTAQGVIQ